MDYLDYCIGTLRRLGLDDTNYTREQIVLIVEPIEAPENYAQDGEISSYEAKENWLNKLRKAGLSPLQRTIIKLKVLG